MSKLQKVSKKYISENTDVDLSVCASTYPCVFEPTERVAYSCGTYGWTGSLFKGLISGTLYASYSLAYDTMLPNLLDNLTEAQHYVIQGGVLRYKLMDRNHNGYACVRLISDTGYFEVETYDCGKTWD